MKEQRADRLIDNAAEQKIDLTDLEPQFETIVAQNRASRRHIDILSKTETAAEPEQEELLALELIQTMIRNERNLELVGEISTTKDASRYLSLAEKIFTTLGFGDSPEAICSLLSRPVPPRVVVGMHINRSSNVGELLRNYLRCCAETKRGLVILERAKRIVGALFPEFNAEIANDLTLVGIRLEQSSNGNPRSNGYYNYFDKIIGITQITNPETRLSLDQNVVDAQMTAGTFGNEETSRKIDDLLLVTHEMFHHIFQCATDRNIRKSTFRLPQDLDTSSGVAKNAIDEGFAVLLELIAIDRLSADAQKFGLSEDDLLMLGRFKRDRLSFLRNSVKKSRSSDPNTAHIGKAQLMYTDGVLKIFHGIYKEGGVPGVLAFVASLDPGKIQGIARNSQEYQAALLDHAKFMLPV